MDSTSDPVDWKAREQAAEAIFNQRHPSPGFRYNAHADGWARSYADAAIDAYLEAVRDPAPRQNSWTPPEDAPPRAGLQPGQCPVQPHRLQGFWVCKHREGHYGKHEWVFVEQEARR